MTTMNDLANRIRVGELRDELHALTARNNALRARVADLASYTLSESLKAREAADWDGVDESEADANQAENFGAHLAYDNVNARLAQILEDTAASTDVEPNEDEQPRFSRKDLKVILAHFESMQAYHYEESGGENGCDGYDEEQQYGISLGFGDAVSTIRDLLDSGTVPIELD